MATQNSSFFRRFAPRDPEPVADDPADLGTAFGLEASLDAVGETDDDAAADADSHPQSERAPMDWLARRGKPRR